MANYFLSGRVPLELYKQVEQYLDRSGESKTEMIIKAVAAYIGVEAPEERGKADSRLATLEQEMADVKGAVQSLRGLYEKLSTLNKIEIGLDKNREIITQDETNYGSEKIDEIKENPTETRLEPEINNTSNGNEFINIPTSEVVKLTGLKAQDIANMRTMFQNKAKKENRGLKAKTILEHPGKITTAHKIQIDQKPYILFYAGQNSNGKTLWNLIPQKTDEEQLPIISAIDNK